MPPLQVLLSKNFRSRPGCRRKILTKEFWGWGWGSKFDPQKHLLSRGPAKRGGPKQGGFPIWTCPSFFVLFCPFLGLSRFFWDFPDLLGDGPGIFPISPFPLSRPSKSTYEEQSRKGPRYNLDLSQEKWETPGFGKPPV